VRTSGGTCRYLILPAVSSLPLTPGGSSPALRAGAALALAVLVHLSAWQTLAGIRLLLPRAEPPTRTMEAALLAPEQTAAPFSARRSVVKAVSGRRRGPLTWPLPLTAVDLDRHERAAPERPAAPPPERRVPKQAAPKAAAPASGASAAVAAGAPTTPGRATPAPSPTASSSGPVQPLPGSVAPVPNPAASAPGSAAPGPSPVAPSPNPAALTSVATAAPTLPAVAAQIVPAQTPAEPAPPTGPARAAVQVVLPKSARFVYDSSGTVRVGGFVLQARGRTTTRWQFQDGRYKSDLSLDVVNFSMSSQGQFDPDYGLAPERFEMHRRNDVFTTLFDWPNRRVSFTDGNRSGIAEPGSQDRLSVQFQLSVLRQVYPERFVRGSVMPITLAGTNGVSHWTFTVTGEDVVDSGIGRLRALRVLSNRTTETGDESLEVWISEKLDWFPARIRMVDKNRNVLDFVLDQATID
jgi:uncharacterized protein DUF3108